MYSTCTVCIFTDDPDGTPATVHEILPTTDRCVEGRSPMFLPTVTSGCRSVEHAGQWDGGWWMVDNDNDNDVCIYVCTYVCAHTQP